MLALAPRRDCDPPCALPIPVDPDPAEDPASADEESAEGALATLRVLVSKEAEMLRAERLFWGLAEPRPPKLELRWWWPDPAAAAASSELEAELNSRDFVRPLWK